MKADRTRRTAAEKAPLFAEPITANAIESKGIDRYL
jgi:hypothetical protein